VDAAGLHKRAHQLIPGGAHTYAKGDDQFPSNAPQFIVRGSGCHVWDAEGREFIEYGMGLRSVTLGHAYPPVIEAASAAMRAGVNFSRPSPLEVETADDLVNLIPSAEMVKFAKNGSDVTTAAVKLARAVTRRDKVAICSSHPFFSTDDWFIGTTAINHGIPESVKALTLAFRYNDLDSLRSLFETFPEEIACVVMEVEKEDPPEAGFLEGVRALCDAHCTLLVFDEIITGFRHALAGAQSQYGVTPDLSTFGKALGNGFSIAALLGKRQFMELGGLYHDRERVFLLSTTYGAETHSLAAAREVMRLYREEPVIETLYARGAQLRAGVTAIVEELGVDAHFGVAGRDCNLVFYTKDHEGSRSQPFRTLLMQELIRGGVIAPSFIVSYSHTRADISRTLDAVRDALIVYRRALEQRSTDGLLEGPPVKPVYRAFN
jgi:glutamate-1-semialdehyde 2,1-aminomutase